MGKEALGVSIQYVGLDVHNDSIDRMVVSPSSIPRSPDGRVKTDRPDVLMLAHFARAGALAPVRVPDLHDGAVRDLVRAREDAVREQRNASHRFKALLLRNVMAYADRATGRRRTCAGWRHRRCPSRRSRSVSRSTCTASPNWAHALPADSCYFRLVRLQGGRSNPSRLTLQG